VSLSVAVLEQGAALPISAGCMAGRRTRACRAPGEPTTLRRQGIHPAGQDYPRFGPAERHSEGALKLGSMGGAVTKHDSSEAVADEYGLPAAGGRPGLPR